MYKELNIEIGVVNLPLGINGSSKLPINHIHLINTGTDFILISKNEYKTTEMPTPHKTII